MFLIVAGSVDSLEMVGLLDFSAKEDAGRHAERRAALRLDRGGRWAEQGHQEGLKPEGAGAVLPK